MTIVCTSDEKYLPLLAVLLESASIHDLSLRFHVRLINTSKDAALLNYITGYPRVKILHDNVELNSKPTKVSTLKRNPDLDNSGFVRDRKGHGEFKVIRRAYSELNAYCTNIKYNTLNTLLQENYDDVLVYLDVDTLIRKPLDDLEALIKKGDIGIVLDGDSLDDPDVDFVDGGLIGVNNTEMSRKFIKDIDKNMDLLDITDDEMYFEKAYKLYKPSIVNLPRSFKEEGGETGEFDTDAYMWSGHGDNKSYCTQYIKEFQRYKENML